MTYNIQIRKSGYGVLLKIGDRKYGLDRIDSKVDVDYNLISHAHYDHLPTKARGRVLASKETLKLAELRGRKYYNILEEHRDIELYNTGHILGSTAFLIENKVLYTGDINDNDRVILKGFNPPQADILIIEATYGSPEYIFGEFKNQMNTLIRFLSRNMLQGRNIVLKAYPLGKPQIISLILNKIKSLYCSPRVLRYNQAYNKIAKMKIPTKQFNSHNIKEPFVLLAASNEKIKGIDKYDPIEVVMSGWTLKFGGGLPISDHSDYKGLIKTIDRIAPKKVYTIYGYADRLAQILRENGYDAQALK